MARGRSSRKFKRRKKYGVVSKRRRRRAASRWPRRVVSTGFPKTMTTKVKYAQSLSLDPGSGGIMAVHNFSANNPYDPDVTGVGHQPMWFDEFRNIYGRARVIWSKIRWEVANNSTSNTYTMFLQCREGATSFHSPTDFNDMRETKGVSYKTIGPRDSTRGHGVLQQSCTLAKKVGAKNYADNNFAIDFRAGQVNPVRQVYWVMGLVPFTGTQDLDALPGQVEVTYVVKWDLVKEVGGS